MSAENPSYQRSSTIASFFILAVASGYYLLPMIQKGFEIDGIHSLLTIIFIQAIVGIFRYVLSKDVQIIENGYQVMIALRQFCILPLFVYQLCLMYSVSSEITMAHLIGMVIALMLWLAASIQSYNRDPLMIFHLFYLCSLAYLCHTNSNYYGLNAGLTFAFAHFVVTDRYTYLDFPAIDFYNYCLCFYMLFCWKALKD